MVCVCVCVCVITIIQIVLFTSLFDSRTIEKGLLRNMYMYDSVCIYTYMYCALYSN